MARGGDSTWLLLAGGGAAVLFAMKKKAPAVEVPSNVVEQPVGLLPNTPQGLPILSQPTAPITPAPPAPTSGAGQSWTQFGPVTPSVFTPTPPPNTNPDGTPVVTPPTGPVNACSTPPVVTDSNHKGAPYGGASLNITCAPATSGAGIPGFTYAVHVNTAQPLGVNDIVEWYNAVNGSRLGYTQPGAATKQLNVNMWRGVQTVPVDIVAFVQRRNSAGAIEGTIAATEVRRIPVTA